MANLESPNLEFSSSYDLARKMTKYFNAIIIGSVILYENDLLESNLINDVDILIYQDDFWNINYFLKDYGFEETKRSYKQSGYADTIGSLKFEKNGFIPIHISFAGGNKLEKLNVSAIIKQKFERFNETDRRQLLYIIENKKPNPEK